MGSLHAAPLPSKGRGKEACTRLPSLRKGEHGKSARGSPHCAREGMGSLHAAPLPSKGRGWGWGLSLYSIYSVDIKNYCCAVNKHRRCFSPDTNIKNLRSLRSKRRLFAGCEAAARRRGLHSVEHRLTLRGASAHAPRSIGLRSTERKTHPLVPSLKMAFRTSFLPVTPERLSYFTFFYFFLVKSC